MKRNLILLGSIIGAVLVIAFGTSAADGEITESAVEKDARAEAIIQQSKENYESGRRLKCDAVAAQYSLCITEKEGCELVDEMAAAYKLEFGFDPIVEDDCRMRENGYQQAQGQG